MMSLWSNWSRSGDCWPRRSSLAAVAGCGHGGSATDAQGSTAARVVPVTVAASSIGPSSGRSRSSARLRGWEQVTVGTQADRPGRQGPSRHRRPGQPGEPLVELDPVDAKLGVQQAESKYLGELVKLGITKQQAEEFVKKYGISEELLIGQVADEAIAKVPAVVQKQVARERAQQHLTRQRALTQRGAGTPQELEDAENDWRTAAANYDDAVQAARTVIANAFASKVALSQAEQTLKDMTIRAPTPKLIPPELQPHQRAFLRHHQAAGLRGADDQGRRGGRRARDRRPDPALEPGPRAILPTTCESASACGSRPGPIPAWPSRARSRGSTRRSTPSSRTFQVETLVPNERGLLRPGGFAKASIITDAEAKAAVVPIESIVRFAGVTKLFIVENGKARSINDIKTGSEGPRLGRGDEQAAPRDRSGRHHRPNPARRRNARRDPRARACRRSPSRAKPAQFPRPPAAPGASSRR